MSGRWDHLRRLIQRQAAACDAGADDAPLLDRFIAERDEVAFEQLLRRHGPMVYAVCRRAVPTAADAEDAFQATFLALISSARKVRQRGSVASWLHGTALHVSADLCRRQQRRHAREAGVARPETVLRGDPARDEVLVALDQEVAGLPDRYRQPVVLCHVLNKSLAEAAAALGVSVSAVWRRVQKGEELLRQRLHRRGITVPAAAMGGMFAAGAAMGEPLPALRGLGRSVLDRASSSEVAALAARAVAPGGRVWAAAAAVTALCGAGLWAAQSIPSRPVAPPPETVAPTVPTRVPVLDPAVRHGVLAGRVVDHAGRPVPQADIIVIGRKHGGAAQSPAEWPARVAAGADGRFRLSIDQPDVAERDGLTLIVLDLVGRGWVVMPLSAVGRTVGGEVVIRLDEPGVRGWVVGPDSQPVAGVTVRAAHLNKDVSARALQEQKGAVSGPDGRFRLPDFDPTTPLRLIAEHLPTGMTATLDVDETRLGRGDVMLKLQPVCPLTCPAK